MPWQNRNSSATIAAATSTVGRPDHSAASASGNNTPATHASRDIHERCGWRSTEIARQVTSLLDDISADGSYKLQLVDHTDTIEWLSGEPGSERVWYTDPETTRLQRFSLKAVAPFAPEELL